MMVVVSYDISTKKPEDQRRLKKVADLCLNYGVRVQYSVFECILEPWQWEILRNKLLSIYNPKQDNLRFYHLGSNWQKRLESYGVKRNFNLDETIIL